MVIINGRRSPICFTTTILSLSIILMMTTTMVKECDGWMTPCNGSTTVECSHVFEVDEEIEFQMDTEGHSWILVEASHSVKHIVYKGVQDPNESVGTNGGGKKYNSRKPDRPCTPYEQCKD